jgi:type I restriction enzyme M protein
MKTMSKISQKGTYKQSSHHRRKGREQQLLFTEENLLPSSLPRLHELHPATNLSAVFDECHNYIYANEGLLKDKIFHEIVKLLIMKLYDEQNNAKDGLQFGITSSDYRNILANRPGNFEKRMAALFTAVRSKYGSLLSDDVLKLKPLTLAYIVGRLQYISLSQTPGDVKGEAFQAFVYRHQRGDRGEFFTPHPIVRLAVEMIAPQPDETIIDPACGSGGFLIQAISYICRNHPHIDKSAYVREHICGIEFNPDVALSAMLRLAFEGGAGTEIVCANALVENEQFNNAFDILLTNPPFGSKGKIEDQRILKSYVLARRWNRTSNDEWEVTRNVLAGQSPEVLFIEKCLKLLRPGGRMAIVLPDGLLQNVSNGHVRFWIRSQAKVLGVVSIPQEAFVPYGTGIKTSLLLLQKLPATTNRVFMAQVKKIGYDVKGQPIYKRDDNGRPVRTPAGSPVIDDDIDDTICAYHRFQRGDLEFESVFIPCQNNRSMGGWMWNTIVPKTANYSNTCEQMAPSRLVKSQRLLTKPMTFAWSQMARYATLRFRMWMHVQCRLSRSRLSSRMKHLPEPRIVCGKATSLRQYQEQAQARLVMQPRSSQKMKMGQFAQTDLQYCATSMM